MLVKIYYFYEIHYLLDEIYYFYEIHYLLDIQGDERTRFLLVVDALGSYSFPGNPPVFPTKLNFMFLLLFSCRQLSTIFSEIWVISFTKLAIQWSNYISIVIFEAFINGCCKL